MPLRSLRSSDVTLTALWLVPIAETVACERWASDGALEAAVGAADTLLYHDGGGEAFLAIASDIGLPEAVRIDLLAVPHDQRRLGVGSCAVLAAERRLRRTCRRIYVAVPARLGLALYFWLRLGYRPLLQNDWPAAPGDASAWMMRELR